MMTCAEIGCAGVETGGSGRIRMQGGSWDMVGSWRESAQSNGMEVDEAVDDLMRSGD